MVEQPSVTGQFDRAQVEDQHLGVLPLSEADRFDIAQAGTVPRSEALAVGRQRAARHMDIGKAVLRQGQNLLFRSIEQSGIDPGVLIDRQGPLLTLG